MMTTEAQHFQALEKENHKNINKCYYSKCLYRYYQMYMSQHQCVVNKCLKKDSFLFSLYIVNHLKQWNYELFFSNHSII